MPRRLYDTEVGKRTISRGTLAGVGRRLRMLRQVLGHKQYEWADALHISPTMLNRWEQGKRQPDIDIMISLCNSTGCTLDFIFRGRLGPDLHPELRARLLQTFDELVFLPSPADVLATSQAPSARAPRQKKDRAPQKPAASAVSARRKTPPRRLSKPSQKRK